MISITQAGPEYEVRFPYNDWLVQTVKQVPGRHWQPQDKCWYVPKDKLGFLLNLLKGTSFEQEVKITSNEDLNVNASVDSTPRYSIPDIDISDVHTCVKDGGKLFPHQEDCIKYSIGRKEKGNFSGFLLADEMGCVSGDSVVEVRVDNSRKLMRLEDLYNVYESGKRVQIKCYADGFFAYLPVRVVLNKGIKPTVSVKLANGYYVVCTPDHELLTLRGWVEACHLSKTDSVVVESDSPSWTDGPDKYSKVVSVSKEYPQPVYDVGVDHAVYHNFVCNGIVVHNCGKTLEVINLALFKQQYEAAKHCLIICCVNSAKYNWVKDIHDHTNGKYEGYILGSRCRKKLGTVNYVGTGKQKLEDLETGLVYSDKKLNKPLPYFLILNVEALRTTDNTKKRNERNVITRRLAELCLDGDISMIALDEIHRNASPQSEQGKQILRLKAMTGSRVEWIPMTGTPVVNKPTDVFLPMRLVDATDCDSYWKWNQRYCIYGGYGGHNVIGYKNIPELKRVLEPNMLRRTKEEVLDLPDKIRQVEYVENTRTQARLYAEVQMDLQSNFEQIRQSANPLGKLIRLRQANGAPEILDPSIDVSSQSYLGCNAKLKRLLEMAQDLTSCGKKIVVFSNWIEPLRTAYRWLNKRKIKTVSYVGTMSQEDREKSKRTFIEDPSCMVILGTIGALGTTHTLTVAQDVIFLDQPWSMADLEQAEDRCYRVGTTGTVNVYYLIAKDTIDDKVYDIIMRKDSWSKFIVDNDLNVKQNPELLKYLIS